MPVAAELKGCRLQTNQPQAQPSRAWRDSSRLG